MKALLVVDMQKVYFKNDVMKRQLSSLTLRTNELIEDFRNNHDIVILIKTEHTEDGSTWTLNMLEDNKPMALSGSSEVGYVNGLQIENCLEITKTRDSSFHMTDLLSLLKQYNVTELVISGILAHTCVFHTAVDAYAYNYPVTLVSDAIGDESEEQKQRAFEYLINEYRQNVV